MATYTSNLNLKKPAANENVNIADINSNMNLIDSAVGNLQSAIGSTKFVRKYCASGSSLTFTFSDSCAFAAFCSGAAPAAKLIVLGNCTTTGTMSYKEIYSGTSSITFNTDTFTITFVNGSTAGLSVVLIPIGGTAPT